MSLQSRQEERWMQAPRAHPRPSPPFPSSLVDNARIYGNEGSVGAALSHVSSVIPRSDLYITTKLDLINNATDVRAEFEDSIRDLGVDYVDLYLVHFPEVMDRGGGYKTVWRAMERLVEEGKAKSVSRTISTAGPVSPPVRSLTLSFAHRLDVRLESRSESRSSQLSRWSKQLHPPLTDPLRLSAFLSPQL